MSPTVFRQGGYRFYIFSREEPRMHVPAICSDGEAQYWLTPSIELARNQRLSRIQLEQFEWIIEEHRDEITRAWHSHFGG